MFGFRCDFAPVFALCWLKLIETACGYTAFKTATALSYPSFVTDV